MKSITRNDVSQKSRERNDCRIFGLNCVASVRLDFSDFPFFCSSACKRNSMFGPSTFSVLLIEMTDKKTETIERSKAEKGDKYKERKNRYKTVAHRYYKINYSMKH